MEETTQRQTVGIHCILAMIYYIAIPLTITTNSSGSSFLKILTLPIAAFFLITFFFYKGKLELNSVHAAYAFYVITVIVTLFIDGSSSSVIYVIGYIQNAALMFFMTVHRYNEREIRMHDYAQLILLGIMLYLGLFGGATYDDRTTMEIFGASCDPNFFCGFFILPIAVCLKQIAEKRLRWLFIPMLLLSVYVVMMSGSRGGLLAVSVTILSFAVISAKDLGRLFVYFTVVIVAAIVFFAIVIPVLPENIAARMSLQALAESKGTYRGDIWISMLDTIVNSDWEFLFGRGINARHTILLGGNLEEVSAHNSLIQTLYNQGVVGLIAFILLAFAAVARNIRKRKHIAAGMIGIIALTMTLSLGPNIKTYWNLIMYAALNMTAAETVVRGKTYDTENQNENEGHIRA